MNAINYNDKMEKLINGLSNKPKLLLHSCCAPCSTACIERLEGFFDITVYYYNPNLDSIEEFDKRKCEQERFCKQKNIKFIAEDYLNQDFLIASCGLESEKEGGSRCANCFNIRLNKTALKAKELELDYFATTLTVSPLKNASLINQIGEEIEKNIGVKYLPSDFKKKGGYLRSIQLSKEYGLYRQNYCGCEYSKGK